jgi:hypothetical protein
MKFRDWILLCIEEKTPFGDLARHVAACGAEFPRTNTKEAIAAYFQVKDHTGAYRNSLRDDLWTPFDRAWSMYDATRKQNQMPR